MDILLLFGSALSFVLAIMILVTKRRKYIPNKVLAFWLIVFSFDFIRSYMLFVKGNLFLLGFGYTLPLLIAVLLFIYVASLIEKKEKFDVRFLWHFVPFVLANVYMYFYLYSASPEWRSQFFEGTSFSSRTFTFNLILLLAVIVYPVYLVWIYVLLRRHVKNIKMVYSCRDQIDLFWINYLLISISVLWFIFTSYKYIDGFYDHLRYNDVIMTFYFFELIIIMIIGYFGFKQGLTYLSNSNGHDKNIEIIKYKTTGLSSKRAKEFLPVLLKYMETNKPYLNPQLTISMLAEQINIPSNHLSQIINEQVGKNFFEFVNNYRIEEVKNRILDNHGQKFTILAIAFDSGFNSKSSFNSIFKKQTGLTPKQYILKHSNPGVK
jgi:AraC-like DNA-binding protein